MTTQEKIETGTEFTPDEAQRLLRQYPYFMMPAVQMLARTTDPEERLDLKRRIAVNIGDRNALRILLGEDPEEFAAFYPDMKDPALSTEDTIETFIGKFGRPEALTDDSLPIAAPAIDYASQILEADMPDEEPEDSMLPPEPAGKAEADNPDSSLSESLAAAMIKTHNYPKAMQIISELSLIYPEKSIYFADQIRFLRKLIIIESKA